MKLSTGIIFCFLILGISSQRWGTFLKEAGQKNLRQQEIKTGNKVLQKSRFNPECDARGNTQIVTDLSKNGDSGYGWEDSRADQFANEWDRSGEDPNHCRPAGQPLASTKLY
ncbi:serum amyloid A-3 protein-like [Bos indicus]|uniref:Serum amyloid A-3 protein-like n=1 Tax=Bos indicus TaxID=9915 RepID=A0ABM4TH20_BOSIN